MEHEWPWTPCTTLWPSENLGFRHMTGMCCHRVCYKECWWHTLSCFGIRALKCGQVPKRSWKESRIRRLTLVCIQYTLRKCVCFASFKRQQKRLFSPMEGRFPATGSLFQQTNGRRQQSTLDVWCLLRKIITQRRDPEMWWLLQHFMHQNQDSLYERGTGSSCRCSFDKGTALWAVTQEVGLDE